MRIVPWNDLQTYVHHHALITHPFRMTYTLYASNGNDCFMAPPCENVSSGIYGQRRPRSDCADAQSDQNHRCPLTESFDTIAFINWEQMPRWDFAHARDESESAHFAHARGTFSLCLVHIQLSFNRFKAICQCTTYNSLLTISSHGKYCDVNVILENSLLRHGQ